VHAAVRPQAELANDFRERLRAGDERREQCPGVLRRRHIARSHLLGLTHDRLGNMQLHERTRALGSGASGTSRPISHEVADVTRSLTPQLDVSRSTADTPQ
jgi:hypothetical protein